MDVVDLPGATATSAINFVLDRAAALLPSPHGFTGVSDVQTVADFSISAVSARAALGGVQGMHLQAYLDEYVFQFNRRKPAQRGLL